MSERNKKLIKKAINKHKSGKTGEAVELYKKILKSEPQHLDANYMLGTLFAESGNPSSALKYLLTAENTDPASHLVKNNLGNVYRLTGDMKTAAHYYEAAIQLNHEMPEACNNLAIVLNRMGERQQAENYYQKAVSLRPAFTEALANLGDLYLSDSRLQDAESCYLRVLANNSQHTVACNGLAECAMRVGDDLKAEEYLRKYLEVSKEDQHGVRLKLAYLSGETLPDKHPKQLVQETYEKKAKNWDNDVTRSEMQYLGPGLIADSVARYYRSTSASLSVLDIGCGTGLCGEFLKPHARILHGVDLSPHMLKEAQKKSIYDELLESDIETCLNDRVDRYDLITGAGVLIFFGDLTSVINSLAAALMEKGRLVFTTYQSGGADVSVRSNIHFAHSKRHIEDVLRAAKLTIDEISPVTHEYDNGQAQPGYLVVAHKSN